MEYRVQKILSNYGYCSRRKAEELIEQNRVKVNGKPITIGDKANPEKDKISVDNKVVVSDEKVYLILNKPKGYLTTLKDPRKRKTVMDLIHIKERVFPVGRLDFNTEGLIILTNDGDFANMIMHPSHELKKTYLVRLKSSVKEEDVLKLRKGVDLIDGKTRPAIVRVINQERTLLEIKIHEGKNRILRRMFNELNYYVVALKRTKIGNLELKMLKPSKYRFLKKYEVEALRKQVQKRKYNRKSKKPIFSREDFEAESKEEET